MAYDLDTLIAILQELRATGEISAKPGNCRLTSRSQKINFNKGTLLEFRDVEDYNFHNSLNAHVECIDPIYEGNDFTILANNPFIGDTGGSAPTGVKQSIEPVLEIEYGTEGEQFFCKANAPVGQSVKLVFAGSYLRIGSLFEPRYWKRFDITGAGGPFGYISTNDLVRNNIWNSPRNPDADLRDNLPDTLIASLEANQITFQSLLGRGSTAITQGSSFNFSERMTRKFFGTIPNGPGGVVGPATRVLCPVAKNAGAVQLNANQTSTVYNDIQPGPTLAMAFRLYNGQEIYNFPQGQVWNIPENTVAILVYATANNAVRELPFELVFDLGF